MEQSTYLKDLEAQMAEQRARKLQEKKDQHADWWEKKTDPAYTLPSPKKPHPSMVTLMNSNIFTLDFTTAICLFEIQ